jgi:hypothetical protein
MYKIFELLPFGFAPKGKEIISIYLWLVFGVHTHLNNEPNLQDTNIDDNSKDQIWWKIGWLWKGGHCEKQW